MKDLKSLTKSQFQKVKETYVNSILEGIEKILPGSDNVQMYREYFENKPDAEFIALLEMALDGNFQVPLIVPNFHGTEVDVKRLTELGKEWGYNFQQHISITDQRDTDVTYEAPKLTWVLEDVVRRQIQTLENKISVPVHADVLDDSTGQVTGDSKGGALSLAETRNLEAKSLDPVIYEYLSPMGGNNEAYQIMEDLVIEQGTVTAEEIQTDERPAVIDMVDVLFKSAHIYGNW